MHTATLMLFKGAYCKPDATFEHLSVLSQQLSEVPGVVKMLDLFRAPPENKDSTHVLALRDRLPECALFEFCVSSPFVRVVAIVDVLSL